MYEELKRQLAIEMYNKGMIKFGEFKLSSGLISPFYIDLRLIPSYPNVAKLTTKLLIKTVEHVDYDYIVGIVTSGVSLASFMSYELNKPMGYVRVERKNHGLRKFVEGVVDNRKVLIVDDVATTGSTLMIAVKTLKNDGARIAGALVVVDREQGAEEILRKVGIKLYYIFKVTELFKILLEEKLINKETYEKVINYINKWKQ